MVNRSYRAALASVVLTLVTLLQQLRLIHGQQIYTNNKQFNCSATPNSLGYSCNGARTTCQSYLTFRSAAPLYTFIPSIAYLLNTSPSTIASLNQLPDISSIPDTTPILVPVTCSCSSGLYYQHNAFYVLKFRGENYFILANHTYQGLTTCQSLIAQNPYDVYNLQIGDNVTVPLRCACPTETQVAAGVKYLATYVTNRNDSVSTVSELFNVSEQSVLNANELSAKMPFFPFNPLLVPLVTEPTKFAVILPASPPSVPPMTGSGSFKKWLHAGIGIVVGVVVTLLVVSAVWLYRSRRDGGGAAKLSDSNPKGLECTRKMIDASIDYSGLPTDSSSWSISVEDLREAIATLALYKFQDLQIATGSFSEANRIKGSVFRGKFKGKDAAVKILKGDVSGEISILRKINHSNIIGLSGFCVHQGNTYFVYEFAENGSLSEFLHHSLNSILTWKQRIRIAFGVAEAINYLHNYTNPPYIHKNLKSSNVLLDSHLRPKIANFGLARSVDDEDGRVQLTRHVVGTRGYMAPEYIDNGVITPMMDVYAFGIVMLEILSGKEAMGSKKGKEELLSTSINRVLDGADVKEKLRNFIDPSLKMDYPLDMALSMAELARKCVAYQLSSRPSIAEVLMTLSKIESSSLDWDPSDELNGSRFSPSSCGRKVFGPSSSSPSMASDELSNSNFFLNGRGRKVFGPSSSSPSMASIHNFFS